MRTIAVLCAAAAFAAGVSDAHAIGERANAELKGRDGKEVGSVSVVETVSGVLLKVKLKGLAPGAHGFHLHDIGKCEGDFSSAGPIYNPLGAKHGFLNEEGPMSGDLPNIYVSATGDVEVEIFSPFMTLNKDAEESVLDSNGTAFVVYEKPDDYVSEPDGKAGTRIACGGLVPAK